MRVTDRVPFRWRAGKQAWAAIALSASGLLAGCNLGASGNASTATFTGRVSAGMPITSGELVVTDSSSPARIFTATVQPDGSYSIDTAGGVAPFLFHAHGRSGSKALNLFAASAAVGGRVNISPVSSLVVASVAGQDCAVATCNPPGFSDAALTKAALNVDRLMVPLLTQFGLAVAESLDPQPGSPARERKWVFFKNLAVGGFVISREGPLEFIKDRTTGNWRMAGNSQGKSAAKSAKAANPYAPPPGASSFGNWLPLSTEADRYPDGATLVVVSSPGIAPPVSLVYTGQDGGAAKMNGVEMVRAVTAASFLPACPRPARQSDPCISVAPHDGHAYSATFSDSAAASQNRAATEEGASNDRAFKAEAPNS